MARQPLQTTIDNGVLTIQCPKKLNFEMTQTFRESYQKHLPDINQIVIDMQETEWIESSGIGLLLLLNSHIDPNRIKVSIVNVNPTVEKIFLVSHIHRIFKVVKSRNNVDNN
ncbi:MAG: STAS domain-containing protein [Magnetococcus sp. DMHC-1]|nr:STAS domain-containing protein [Magnetococcales bacterium]